MKTTFTFKSFISSAVGFLILLAMSASAQIGGSGWSPETVSFNVQWPYNVSESSRYTYSGGVYHMLVYSNDAPFEKGSTTLPRTEQRFNPDYTSGEIQYQAEMMCPANENSYCIFQIHTGDAQETQFGSTTFMLFWFSSDGGSVHDYSGTELAGNLGGQWFTVNADHNLVTHTITIWINGKQVWTQQDNGATDFYLKDGVYEQNHGPTYQMDTYVKNIQIWTSSGVSAFSGYYKLVDRNSGKVPAVKSAATTNGAPVILYTFGTAQNDQWQFVPTDSGYYKLLNRKSGLSMAVQGASTADSALIIQWTFGSAQNDQWEPVSVGSGYYNLVNRHSGKLLEVQGAGTANNTPFDQYHSTGGNNQQFQLISTN
jgi:hypothetical protein